MPLTPHKRPDEWPFGSARSRWHLRRFPSGWNVYRDVILKPRLKVTVNVSRLVSNVGGQAGTYIVGGGINFGPGELTVAMVHGEVASVWERLTRNAQKFVLTRPSPAGDQLPVRLRVGDKTDVLFEYREDCFLREDPTHIGLRDSFGRIHWAPHQDVEEACSQFKGDFGNESSAEDARQKDRDGS